MQCARSLPVTEASAVGEARRAAAELASAAGLGETASGQLALVVTEAANSLHKFAPGGEIVLSPVELAGRKGVEVLSLDRGPGMVSITDCLRDGYSTAGTPGTGLGAIQRLAHEFDLYSQPGVGTALVARVWESPLPPAPAFQFGAVALPKEGEEACGDAWVAHHRAQTFAILVADGLGHGQFAAEAAWEAVRVFRGAPDLAGVELLERMHRALRSTRGAAAALSELDLGRGVVRFAGIGNIAGVVISGPSRADHRSMVSHNGIVGHQLRKVQSFEYPLPAGALVILHSDGLTTSWQLERYPGLLVRHPSLIAGILYRDAARGHDDVTVVVVKHAG